MPRPRLHSVVAGMLCFVPALATAGARKPMEQIVVTATRTERSALEAPYMLHVLDSDVLSRELQARTVPEALRQIPGISIQKTAHGQGSPYIRGFTGFRTLFMIDGIRLNNSTFRDGPNQYWNTVDPLTIARLEIVKGPSSVLYGSDAIGGTVNALLISPLDTPTEEGVSARVSYRAADAEDAGVGRAQVGYRHGDVSLLAGYSLKDFGDLESGGGLLPKTGYDEVDVDLRVEYELGDTRRLVFAHQQLEQDDAWRTHQTVYAVPFHGSSVGRDLARIYEQGRNLTYGQYYVDDRDGVVNAWHVSLSGHEQDEFLFRQRGDNGRFELQGYDVDTAGLTLQAQTEAGAGRWVYGLEHYHDQVTSYRRDLNADGSLRGVAIQGPVADDATYDLGGLYVERQLPLAPRWELIPGLRYTYAEADAGRVQNPVGNTFMQIEDDWSATVGSVRFRYAPALSNWSVFGGVSEGFRAPNLSDLTRLDTARTNEIETPVATLEPESFVSYEVGYKLGAARSSFQVALYYTNVDDLIVRAPTGQIVQGSNEVTKRNSGKGFARGLEIEGGYDLTNRLTLIGAFNWIEGELDTYPTSAPVLVRQPMDKMMPEMALVGLRWRAPSDRYWIETSALHANDQFDLSASDRADTSRIPPGGTPGYTVLNVRSRWSITPSFTLAAAVENVTDQNYRVHGSGLNEPGRNFVVTLDWEVR
jgi:hemoglobin/transferrin/lactoferrin receptor protein